MSAWLRERLSQSLGIRPGEVLPVAGMFVHSLLVGSVLLFTLTSANALFLARVGIGGLPFVYLTIAVVGPLTAAVFLKLVNRWSQRPVWRLSLLATALGFLLLRLLFHSGDAALAAFCLLVWYRVAEGLLNLEFWGVAGSLLDVRQARRLYGLIGSGEVLALVVGGFGLPLLVSRLGSENLLLLAAGASVLCLPVLEWLLRRARQQHGESGERSRRSSGAAAATAVHGPYGSYVRLILGLFLVSILMRFLVDKSFLLGAERSFPDADALAGFLGVFYAAAGVTTLALRSLASARLLARFGLGVALALLPFSLALASVGTILAVGAGLPALLVFWSLSGLKFFDRAFRLSIDRQAVLLLFQPLPAAIRARAQTLAEGAVGPLATGLAGAVLLLLDRFGPTGAGVLPWLMLLCCGVWVVIGLRLHRAYPLVLTTALQRRQLGPGSLRALDPSGLALLRRKLLDPDPGVALPAFELLEEADPDILPTVAPGLLDHPAAEVRLAILRRLKAGDRQPAALARLRQLAAIDPVAEVRATALRLLAPVDESPLQDRLAHDLRSSHGDLRTAALVGLLRHGRREGRRMATLTLRSLLRGADPAERTVAAVAMGQLGSAALRRPLAVLLVDPDPGVRRAALAAAGQLDHPALWPLVIARLDDPDCAAQAARALLGAGTSGVEALIAALAMSGIGSAQEQRILRLLGRSRSPLAVEPLLARIAHRDSAVRHGAMVALAACGHRAGAAATEPIERQLVSEVRQGAWLLSALGEVSHDWHEVLPMALANELERTRDRLLLLAGFLHDGGVRQARLRYWTGSPRERAIALELLEAVLAPSVRDLAFPLLERLAPAAALRQLPEELRPDPLPANERLLEILEARRGVSPDSWIRACALYCAACSPRGTFREAVAEALGSGDPVVAETALLATWSLDPGQTRHHATKMALADHPRLRPLIARIATRNSPMDGSATVEKVLLLRSVGIFSSTPSDVLLQLAHALEEVDLAAGQTLFQQGELGTSMYVIIEGSVRVHIGDQTIVELGEREIVGELAALDPEPRSASVTAIRPTRLFRIEQESLLELMVDQPEIIQGVIRELAKRIRLSTAREVTEEAQPS